MKNSKNPSKNNRVNLKESKPQNRLRFAGASALILSVVGVLMAVGGQLDFIGQDRPKNKVKNETVVKNGKQPKYSFYEDLKKRKTELDNSNQAPSNSKVANKTTIDKNSDSLYLVQIGAFTHKADAEKIRVKAKALGFKVKNAKSGTRYLVQAGPFRGKKTATKAEKILQNAKFPTLIRRVK